MKNSNHNSIYNEDKMFTSDGIKMSFIDVLFAIWAVLWFMGVVSREYQENTPIFFAVGVLLTYVSTKGLSKVIRKSIANKIGYNNYGIKRFLVAIHLPLLIIISILLA
tara:strand:+ start:170 stop:493 length:324 start_codon:yes stop_codon:yes gene_type:complete